MASATGWGRGALAERGVVPPAAAGAAAEVDAARGGTGRGHRAGVVYREMPNTRELLALCEGIYLMRMEARLTALKDEVRLFENLIKVFRAPSILLRMTGRDGVHWANDCECWPALSGRNVHIKSFCNIFTIRKSIYKYLKFVYSRECIILVKCI